MNIATKTLTFVIIGLALSGLIALLSSAAPNIFGWLTLPFWVIPAIFGFGAHDMGWVLFAASGTLCYGGLAFAASALWRHYNSGR